MKEKEKNYYEYGEKGECRYGLATINSCRKCLFETLCRLEQSKCSDTPEVDQISEKNL